MGGGCIGRRTWWPGGETDLQVPGPTFQVPVQTLCPIRKGYLGTQESRAFNIRAFARCNQALQRFHHSEPGLSTPAPSLPFHLLHGSERVGGRGGASEIQRWTLENSAPLTFLMFGPSFTHRETPAARDVVLHQTSGRIHNKNVSTHLIGNIKQGKGGKELKEQGSSGRKLPCPHSCLHSPHRSLP